MKKKLIISLLIVPLVIVGSLLLGIYLVIATETGTQWLAENTASYLPDTIIVEGVSGRLIDEIVIQRVQIKHCENISILSDIRIHWDPIKLLNKEVEVHDATLGSANISVAEQCEDKKEIELPDEIKLPVELVVHKFKFNDITIKNKDKGQHIEQVQGSIFLQSDDFSIKQLTLIASQYKLETSLSGKLKTPFKSDGNIKWNLVDENNTSWQGRLVFKGDINEILVVHTLQQPLQVDSEITVFQPLRELKYIAKNRWTNLQLPIGQEPIITFENGDFQLEGDLSSASYTLSANVKSKKLPSIANLQLKGIANQQVITISDFQLNSDQGALSGNGQVNLKPTIHASFSAQGKQINPEFVIAELPGKLDINADVTLSQSKQGIAASIDLKSLSGTLRDYKVKGNGKLHYAHDQIQAEQFNFAIGENVLHLNGLLGAENNKVNFKITAKNLSQIHPHFSGRVEGEGSLVGSIKTPNIQAVISGEQIKIDDRLTIANILFDGNVHVFSDLTSNAKIQASRIIVNDNQIGIVNLTAKGNQRQHQVNLEIQGKDISSTFNLTGSYTNDIWRGVFNQLQAEVPSYGKWELVRRSEIQYGPQGLTLTNTCLSSLTSSICVKGQSDAMGIWQAKGKVSEFPLQLLAKHTQELFKIDGVAHLEFDLHGDASQFEGGFKLISKNTTLRSAFLEEHDESLLIKQLELIGNLNTASSKFDLNIEMDKGYALGYAVIENINQREMAFIREGVFKAEFTSIKFINVLASKISINEGSLSAHANLHGYLKQPEVESNVKLAGLKFHIPDLGTEYTNGELTASSIGRDSFNLMGHLQSQNGQLSLNGKINIRDKLSYSINLKGENFHVLHLPNKSLALSPDLNINGAISKVDINGMIEIPSANLVLKELPKGTVKISADEIIVTEQEENHIAKRKKAIDVTGKVQLRFGEDVHFEGKGIQTDLIGELLVRLENKQVPNGQGVLEFKNSSYQVLGQTLDISSGKMLFAGSINNPVLDVKVTRKSGEVTAGMKIEGTVKKPKTHVFSSPAMSDANALSYLISGRPLAESSGSQNALLEKAALSLGVDKSGSITQQIGSSLGLDELNVSGDEDLESTSLLLGKYLSPRLYVSYAHGLFTSVGTVGFDYQLTKKISVEAESGEAQAIDLIYTIERD